MNKLNLQPLPSVNNQDHFLISMNEDEINATKKQTRPVEIKCNVGLAVQHIQSKYQNGKTK